MTATPPTNLQTLHPSLPTIALDIEQPLERPQNALLRQSSETMRVALQSARRYAHDKICCHCFSSRRLAVICMISTPIVLIGGAIALFTLGGLLLSGPTLNDRKRMLCEPQWRLVLQAWADWVVKLNSSCLSTPTNVKPLPPPFTAINPCSSSYDPPATPEIIDDVNSKACASWSGSDCFSYKKGDIFSSIKQAQEWCREHLQGRISYGSRYELSPTTFCLPNLESGGVTSQNPMHFSSQQLIQHVLDGNPCSVPGNATHPASQDWPPYNHIFSAETDERFRNAYLMLGAGAASLIVATTIIFMLCRRSCRRDS